MHGIFRMTIAELEASARHAMRVGAFATAYRVQAEIERRRVAA